MDATLGFPTLPPPPCIVWVSFGEHSGSGSQLNILVIELTNDNALPISKAIPPSAPKPKLPAIGPANDAPPPIMAFKILELEKSTLSFDLNNDYMLDWDKKTIFNNISSRYDFLNSLLSFGLHKLWKKN